MNPKIATEYILPLDQTSDNPAKRVPLLVKRMAKKKANPTKHRRNKRAEFIVTTNNMEKIELPSIPIITPLLRYSGFESRSPPVKYKARTMKINKTARRGTPQPKKGLSSDVCI